MKIVVSWSLSFLGHVFYPAGLHFAVADDGFCSADVSPEEVQAYIEKVRHEYRALNSDENFPFLDIDILSGVIHKYR